MKILLISGGSSSERKISFLSANEVRNALEANKHKVKIFDLKAGFPALKKLLPDFDIAFPVLHGEEGEGGKLQEFLFKQKIPYVGGNPEGFKEGWFKISFKKFCDKNNILTSPWKEVRDEKDIVKFGLPCVVKSSNGGSSLEVVILKKPEDLKSRACRKLIESDSDLFVEKFLPGVEVTVSILGNQVLPILEIILPNNKLYDYENKYSGLIQETVNAPSLSAEIRTEIQEIALKIHQKLKLGSLSRMDFIVSDNQPYVLEVNTIPGFTPTSSFPQSAKAIGLSFEQLIEKLVTLSLKK